MWSAFTRLVDVCEHAYLCGLGDAFAKDLDFDVAEGGVECDRHCECSNVKAGQLMISVLVRDEFG